MELLFFVIGFLRDHLWLVIILIVAAALLVAARKTADSIAAARKLESGLKRIDKDQREIKEKMAELMNEDLFSDRPNK